MRQLFCSKQCLQNRNKPHFMCRTQIALNCAMKPGPHSEHRAGINSARQPRLLVAHFWKQEYESVCEQACECMCVVVGECVCRKSKILQHRSLQLVVYWKQARAPAPQVDQPLPRHCGKLGGLRNMEASLSPGLFVQSMDYQSNLCQLCVFPCKHCKSWLKKLPGRLSLSWPYKEGRGGKSGI